MNIEPGTLIYFTSKDPGCGDAFDVEGKILEKVSGVAIIEILAYFKGTKTAFNVKLTFLNEDFALKTMTTTNILKIWNDNSAVYTKKV